jgi:hypothetical protein
MAVFGQQTVWLFPTVCHCANGAPVLDIMLAGWLLVGWPVEHLSVWLTVIAYLAEWLDV